MINFLYIDFLLYLRMELKNKLRNYRRRTESFPEQEQFVMEHSGFLFRSTEERNHFTNVDDMFFTDTSV